MSDITYLRTREAFVYLALITDKFSRKIVGRHVGDTLEAVGCLKALDLALANCRRVGNRFTTPIAAPNIVATFMSRRLPSVAWRSA